MRRREFIALLASTALASSRAVRAQQPAMPVIGFLGTVSPETVAHAMAAFHRGLKETGYVEGQNIAVEYRWAEGHYERLPQMAAELVERHVDVIVATAPPAALAAKAATATIPIVFSSGSDPVKLGLVDSISRPGGNVTGATYLTAEQETKRLEFLHRLVPAATAIGALLNSTNPDYDSQLRQVKTAAQSIGLQVEVLSASSESDVAAAFARFAQLRVGALLVGADPFFNSRHDQLVALAARYALPAIYQFREFALAGGLISYGTNNAESYLQAGIYAGRILHGARPADLPVVQASKFELVINLKTAKALGLEVPPTLLALADEVIE